MRLASQMPRLRLPAVSGLFPSSVILSIGLFSLLTVLPLTLWDYGGDVIFQFVGIKCFASQFWAGDLYPRWCGHANAGLGSPVFIYYFPLPFYAASLLYPLTWLGLGIPQLYLACLWLVTFVSGLTAWRWLSGMTRTHRRALFLALVYLWLPYRMELMMFRSAYGELWCMAFLPLVFAYTRQLAQGNAHALPKLAMALALCFLSNMPAAVIGVLASGGWLLLMTTRAYWQPLAMYAASLLWATLLSLFYLGPAIFYKPYVTTEGVMSGQRSWSNDFLTMANITEHGQGHVVVAIGLMLLATLGLFGFYLWKRAYAGDGFIHREIRAWAILAVAAVFLMFPASRFVWDHAGFIAMLAFPWRMQLVVAFAAMVAATVTVDRLLPAMQDRSRTGDAVISFAMLGLVATFVISARAPDFITHGNEMLKAQFITQREYRTQWTDKPYIAMDYILWREQNRGRISKAERVSGDGHIEVQRWDADRIIMDAIAHEPSQFRLDLQYFPVWQARSQPSAQITLAPEQGNGQLLLSMPSGHYEIELSARIFTLSPVKIAACYILSLLSLIVWAAWPCLHAGSVWRWVGRR